MKTAIVTGASKGVGLATVKLLAASGYKVIAVSRNLSHINSLDIPNIETYQLDITKEHEIKKFFEQYKDIKLDLLVNNAGGGSSPNKIINETFDNFRIAHEINVSGPMLLSQLFVPCLQKSKSPVIIFITSLGGVIPYRSGGNYVNAKRGERGLVELMRLEFPEYGIKVTEICPGTINTQDEPKNNALTAEDLAKTILWVSSLESHININNIEISHINNSKFN